MAVHWILQDSRLKYLRNFAECEEVQILSFLVTNYRQEKPSSGGIQSPPEELYYCGL